MDLEQYRTVRENIYKIACMIEEMDCIIPPERKHNETHVNARFLYMTDTAFRKYIDNYIANRILSGNTKLFDCENIDAPLNYEELSIIPEGFKFFLKEAYKRS